MFPNKSPSSAGSMPRTLRISKAIEETAADWLSRCDAELTPEQQSDFEKWLQADPRHATAFSQLESSWRFLDRPMRSGVASEVERELARCASARRRRRYVAGSAVAAMLLFTGLIWRGQFTHSTNSVTPSRSVAVLMPTQQRLEDGSVVELKDDAEIETHFDSATRHVVLRHGEALFHVTKNAQRPFIVVAGTVEVRAVGTVFSVQLGKKEVGVLVTEGRVAVEKPSADDPLKLATALPPDLPVLIAGQRASVNLAASAVAEVHAVLPAEMTAMLAWRMPRLEFSATPLSEAIATINRYNHVQYVIDDPSLGREAVSGLFRADNADAFIRMLQDGFGITTERRGDKVTLRKAQ